MFSIVLSVWFDVDDDVEDISDAGKLLPFVEIDKVADRIGEGLIFSCFVVKPEPVLISSALGHRG